MESALAPVSPHLEERLELLESMLSRDQEEELARYTEILIWQHLKLCSVCQVVQECGRGGRQQGCGAGQVQTQQAERGARAQARAGELKLSKQWPACKVSLLFIFGLSVFEVL